MTYSYVVIGGGIAGTNAAFTIRKNDPEGSILIIGDEPVPVYSRVSLGKIVYGAAEPEKLILKQYQQYEDQLIDTEFGKRVVDVHFGHKMLELSDGSHVGYEKLLIATGGRARELPVPGADLEGVYNFQSMADAIQGLEYVEDKDNIFVVGGGFIGIEFVDIFARMGKKMTLMVREPWYWSTVLLERGGEILDEYIREHAEVRYESEITEIHGDSEVSKVTLDDGSEHEAGGVFVGIGLKLNHDFITDETLQKRRGILVNEYMQTSVRDVYAVGDVAEYYDVIQQSYVGAGTWAVASMQGMTVGHNMTHPTQLKKFEFVPSFCPKIPLPVAFVGQSRIGDGLVNEILEDSEKRYIQGAFRNDILVGAAILKDSAMMGKMSALIKKQATKEEVVTTLLEV